MPGAVEQTSDLGYHLLNRAPSEGVRVAVPKRKHTSYQRAEDMEITVLVDDIRDAKCQDPMACTLALAGARAVGFPIHVAVDEETMNVGCRWLVPSPSGDVEHYGILLPHTEAFRLLMFTDTNREALLRRVRRQKPEEMRLTLSEHHFRYAGDRKRTPEERDRERAREQELKRLRAEGLVPPPAKRNGPKVRRGRPMRGLAIEAAELLQSPPQP